jgi:hypothetical protein
MPRVRRLASIPYGWYFVVLAARRGCRLVHDNADLAILLGVLRSTLRDHGVHLHAGRVTASEAWFALQASDGPITTTTGVLCHEYARLFNDGHQTSGALFKRHPYVLLFQHELWLIRLVHFIHGNDQGFEQRKCCWTTAQVYAEHLRITGITTHVVFRLLSKGSSDRSVQDRAYRESAKVPLDPEVSYLLLHGSPEDSRLLGDAAFIACVRRRTRQNGPGIQKPTDEATFKRIHAAAATVLSKFREECNELLGPRKAREWRCFATLENIRSKSRKVPLPLVRLIIATHVIGRGIATRAQLARFFDCHPTSLSLKRRKWCEATYPEWFVQCCVSTDQVDRAAPFFWTRN